MVGRYRNEGFEYRLTFSITSLRYTSLCRCRGPLKPPGVDQGLIDGFNFLIERRQQLCKDCEFRLLQGKIGDL